MPYNREDLRCPKCHKLVTQRQIRDGWVVFEGQQAVHIHKCAPTGPPEAETEEETRE